MKYPALDVSGAEPDMVLAIVDDCGPTAVEDLPDGISIFFSSPARRDEARNLVAAALPEASLTAREVDDEDWARRSQQNLTPITVGRITVTPPWFADGAVDPSHTRIVILPSMGFGTGHHATTRLCLAALQGLAVEGASVLDVGTGSGVLALAAAALGAREATGIDMDPDAVANARENRDLNAGLERVRFDVIDLRDMPLPKADIVLANLTGAVLAQNAAILRSAVSDGGTLIVSGLQTHERDAVLAAFRTGRVRRLEEEGAWAAIAFDFPAQSAV